jgi:beta-glucosidase
MLDFTSKAGTALPAGTTDTWTGTLTVPSTGDYWLNMQSLGATATLTVDGKLITTSAAGFGNVARYGVVHATDGSAPTATPDGLANNRTLLHLTAGTHTLKVNDTPDVSGDPVQVRLDWVTPQQVRANDQAAVAAAKAAKTAVVFAWDTGSGDLSTPLPDGQDKLIERIAKVNPNTIVVLQSGQPTRLPWIKRVKAVVEAWYGGDKAGVAASDVLMGTTDPGGRLPMTWPYRLDQEVAHQKAHPARQSAGVLPDGKRCTATQSATDTRCMVTYSEGIDIGYRYFDAMHEKPRYPFGYGLSYTTFHYSGLTVGHVHSGGLSVSFKVTNSGKVAGQDVPQVYLGAPAHRPSGIQFAPKALAAYTRVALAPGQSRTVRLTVPKRQLQYWAKDSRWTTATGHRTVSVGTNERSAALTRSVTIG